MSTNFPETRSPHAPADTVYSALVRQVEHGRGLLIVAPSHDGLKVALSSLQHAIKMRCVAAEVTLEGAIFRNFNGDYESISPPDFFKMGFRDVRRQKLRSLHAVDLETLSENEVLPSLVFIDQLIIGMQAETIAQARQKVAEKIGAALNLEGEGLKVQLSEMFPNVALHGGSGYFISAQPF